MKPTGPHAIVEPPPRRRGRLLAWSLFVAAVVVLLWRVERPPFRAVAAAGSVVPEPALDPGVSRRTLTDGTAVYVVETPRERPGATEDIAAAVGSVPTRVVVWRAASDDPAAGTAHARTDLDFVVGRETPVPSAGLDVRFAVTLAGFDHTRATYRVRVERAGTAVAAPLVTARRGGRVLVGARDGATAPWAFLDLGPSSIPDP